MGEYTAKRICSSRGMSRTTYGRDGQHAWPWLGSKRTLSFGTKFKSEGYLPEELGPLEFERASMEPVREQAVAMGEYTNGQMGSYPGVLSRLATSFIGNNNVCDQF
jgi:hypothetical protein